MVLNILNIVVCEDILNSSLLVEYLNIFSNFGQWFYLLPENEGDQFQILEDLSYSGINSAMATPQNIIWKRKNPTTKIICPCLLILVASSIVSTGSPPQQNRTTIKLQGVLTDLQSGIGSRDCSSHLHFQRVSLVR